MIDYNYHTHTFRCGHARGLDRDYVEAAIAKGIKVLGFSDHIIFENDNKELFEDYLTSVNALKEEYKDKIEIHLGFECEYLPERVDYFKYLLDSGKVEYLLLGQHFMKDNDGKLLDIYFCDKHRSHFVKKYFEHLKAGVETGLFSYICHPDIFCLCLKSRGYLFKKYARKICKLAKEHNLPIEINLNGHFNWKVNKPQYKYCYPFEEFFKIASKYKNDIIIGIDCHDPFMIGYTNTIWADHILKKYNLNHVTRLDFKK